MATLTNHRLAVGLELRMDYANAGNDQTLIDMRLNQAVRKVLRDLQCYVTSQTVTPGANKDYSLAAGVLDVIDMSFTQSSYTSRLERLSVPDLLYLRSQGTAGTRPTHYAFAGNNTVMFYPTPGASDTLEMYYVPAPTEMSSGSHDSSSVTPTNYGGIPVDYDYLIQLWALHLLASFDDDQSSGQGQRYLDQYRQGVVEAKGELRRKGGHRKPKWFAGGPRALVGSRSQDIGPWQMATDQEVRSKKLDELRAELQKLKDARQRNNEQIRLAKLEDDAQATLSPEQRDALNQGGITDKSDLSVLQAERDRLTTLVNALQALIDSVRTVA